MQKQERTRRVVVWTERRQSSRLGGLLSGISINPWGGSNDFDAAWKQHPQLDINPREDLCAKRGCCLERCIGPASPTKVKARYRLVPQVSAALAGLTRSLEAARGREQLATTFHPLTISPSITRTSTKPRKPICNPIATDHCV